MKNAILYAGGITAILFLSVHISSSNDAMLIQKGLNPNDTDLVRKIFGEFGDYLSYVSYLESNIYFHGGLYEAAKECGEAHEFTGHSAEEHHHHHEGEHEEESAVTHTRGKYNFLLNISNTLGMTEHKHLSGNEEKEILPWIYYAVRLGPKNVLAYSVGSYWLAYRLDKKEEAVKLLQDGLKNNPDSWELNYSMGDIYFTLIKDYKKANVYLKRAEICLREAETDRSDRRKLFVLLAESYLKIGDKEDAAKAYENILKDFPGDTSIQQKISSLLDSVHS